MDAKYSTPQKALEALKQEYGEDIYEISKVLNNIHPSHLYNYYMRYRKKPSPTLVRTLRELGYISKRIRSQITWESKEQKEAFQWYVQSLNTTISDYCRDIANSNMEAYKHDKQKFD